MAISCTLSEVMRIIGKKRQFCIPLTFYLHDHLESIWISFENFNANCCPTLLTISYLCIFFILYCCVFFCFCAAIWRNKEWWLDGAKICRTVQRFWPLKTVHARHQTTYDSIDRWMADAISQTKRGGSDCYGTFTHTLRCAAIVLRCASSALRCAELALHYRYARTSCR